MGKKRNKQVQLVSMLYEYLIRSSGIPVRMLRHHSRQEMSKKERLNWVYSNRKPPSGYTFFLPQVAYLQNEMVGTFPKLPKEKM